MTNFNEKDFIEEESNIVIKFFCLIAIIALFIVLFASTIIDSVLVKEIRRECIQTKSWAHLEGYRPSKEIITDCRRVGIELPAKRKKEVKI